MFIRIGLKNDKNENIVWGRIIPYTVIKKVYFDITFINIVQVIITYILYTPNEIKIDPNV